MLLPKEHGAYGQMAFPMLTALAVGGVATSSLLTAVAVAAAFLSHEALAVLLGRRGPRARREDGRHAAIWVAATVAVSVAAGVAAVALTAPGARWPFVFPIVGALVVGWLFAIREDKSAAGEIAVALTFSSVALPMCVSAGTSWPSAAAVALAFATLFVVATLAVRVVVLGTRGGGNPGAVRATRLGLCVVCVVSAAGLAALRPWFVPALALAASVPGVLAALVIAMRPPASTALRRLGWTFIVLAMVTSVVLVVALRRA